MEAISSFFAPAADIGTFAEPFGAATEPLAAATGAAADIGAFAEPFGAAVEPLAAGTLTAGLEALPTAAPAAANVAQAGFNINNSLPALMALSAGGKLLEGLVGGGQPGPPAPLPLGFPEPFRGARAGAEQPPTVRAPTAAPQFPVSGMPSPSSSALKPFLPGLRANWQAAGLSGASPEFMAAMAGMTPEDFEALLAQQMRGR